MLTKREGSTLSRCSIGQWHLDKLPHRSTWRLRICTGSCNQRQTVAGCSYNASETKRGQASKTGVKNSSLDEGHVHLYLYDAVLPNEFVSDNGIRFLNIACADVTFLHCLLKESKSHQISHIL